MAHSLSSKKYSTSFENHPLSIYCSIAQDFCSLSQSVGSASSAGLFLFEDACRDQFFDISEHGPRRSLRYFHPLVSGQFSLESAEQFIENLLLPVVQGDVPFL